MIYPHKYTLANGLRVVSVEMPHLHSAELAIYLKVGARNDPSSRAGLSHFLEHILFRGTEDFGSSLEIENAFEAIGGAPNAATDADSTCYYSRVHPGHIRKGMQILASMLLRPLFAGIETEQKIIAEEAREDLNEHGQEINPEVLISRLLWPNHPLGLPTIGTLDCIAAVTRADLENHLHSYYIPGSAVVVVAGPVQHQEIFADAEAVFGNWKGGAAQEVQAVTKRYLSPKVSFVRDSDSQMAMQLGFLGFARNDPRFMSLRLLRRLLAGGGSSRLHLRLREELGIVYSVEGAIGAYDETGCLAIDLSTAPETLLKAVDVTLFELKRLTDEPIPAAEMERVRQSYIFDLEYSQDSAFEMGGRYGWGELMGVVKSIEEDQQEARSITAEDLRQTARDLFAPENLRLVAVGPWKTGMKKRATELVERFGTQTES